MASKRPMVTLAMLRNAKACAKSLAKFRQIFGEEAELTVANVRLAHRCGLPVGFLLSNMLRLRYDDNKLWRYNRKRGLYVMNLKYVIDLLFEPAR